MIVNEARHRVWCGARHGQRMEFVNVILSKLVEQHLLADARLSRRMNSWPPARALDDVLHQVAGGSEEKILRFLANYFDVPFADLEKEPERYAPSKELLAKFPVRLLLDHHILPLAQRDDGVTVLTSRLFDSSGLDQLRLATGLDIHPVVAPSAEIDRFIKKYLGVGADTLQSMGLDGAPTTSRSWKSGTRTTWTFPSPPRMRRSSNSSTR